MYLTRGIKRLQADFSHKQGCRANFDTANKIFGNSTQTFQPQADFLVTFKPEVGILSMFSDNPRATSVFTDFENMLWYFAIDLGALHRTEVYP